MTTARTLVRFVFAGLFVNALAVACVVSDGDDDDDTTACDPGSYKDCTCPNGDASERKCSASGNGYGACACSGENVGGGGAGGEPSTTAGTTSNYGGEGGSTAGGAGGESVGGMASEGGAAGAGGAETDPDAVCIESSGDDCLDCMQLDCCEAWKACSAETEGDCQQQAYDILICASSTERGPDDGEAEVTPEELEDCAQDIAGNDVWSAGVLPTTKAVIDCVAGGQGWGAKDDLSASSCNSLCFIATE